MVAPEDEVVARARTRIRTVLGGKYRLDRLLGAGGMAAVYEASHVRLGNRVAIKLLHPELTLNAGVRERFLREGYLANAVEHPAVVRVLDDGVADDGSLFLVMELLSGEPLEALWARSGRRLSVAETLTLMLELLSVLAAAHARHILHRDVKIENLFIGSDGRLRVLDFGIARQRVVTQTNTLTGDVFGTPWYMPAEQALGTRDVDARSDLWAVGATAFTLLTGRYVHGDGNETVQQALVLASTKSAPPLASVAPHVPAPVAAVFDRALAFRRENRWPGAEAMREALATAQDEMIRGSLHGYDEEDEVVRTRVASVPPAMTPPARARGPEHGENPHTVPLPTVPAANTVGGVASDHTHRRYPHRLAEALRGFGRALRRLGSTLAAVTASSTLRYRRRAAVSAAIGLAAALSLGTIALFALRTTSRPIPSASASGIASAMAAPTSSGPEPAATPTSEAAEPETAPTPPESAPPPTSAPAVASATTTTRPRTPAPIPRSTIPKAQRPRRDPLAP